VSERNEPRVSIDGDGMDRSRTESAWPSTSTPFGTQMTVHEQASRDPGVRDTYSKPEAGNLPPPDTKLPDPDRSMYSLHLRKKAILAQYYVLVS
jgi:hypothetical protein